MTPRELKGWRDLHGLKTSEFAFVLGLSESGLRHKLAGRRPITGRLVRQLNAFDMLIAHGIPPCHWPMRLHRRVHARMID